MIAISGFTRIETASRCCSAALSSFRGVATRYDKTLEYFSAFLSLAVATIWLPYVVNRTCFSTEYGLFRRAEAHQESVERRKTSDEARFRTSWR